MYQALRAREHGGPEKNAFDSRLFFGFSQRASGRGKAKRWIDFFVIWPFTCLYIFNGLIIVFNEAFFFYSSYGLCQWIESHVLQPQNAGKHILATIEFQNFPGEHAPRTHWRAKPSRPCQFFARVSNSVALLFKTLMNPLEKGYRQVCKTAPGQ